ncbi:MAG: AAA family ATPase [Firmicutes bacterium]|nr:AAA family ATPase [Bacillota bacterium]
MQTLTVNTQKTVFSSRTAVYKTERFLALTRAFFGIDLFLEKLAESVILESSGRGSGVRDQGSGVREADEKNKSFIPDTEPGIPENRFRRVAGDGDPYGKERNKAPSSESRFCLSLGEEHFYFTAQSATDSAAYICTDIVFYRYAGPDAFVRRGDKRLLEFLKADSFPATLSPAQDAPPAPADFLKLYRLSGSDYVNFPLLDETQARIVTTEDQNMLVQGVAGSGKTNLCIDKIVYSAARSYAGRTLYCTFSRGLLLDTKGRVSEFTARLSRVLHSLEDGSAVFIGGDAVRAVENKLGFSLPVTEDKIVVKLKEIATYLDDKVDYFLIEDLYARYVTGDFEVADEPYFTGRYVKDIKNHQLSGKLSRLSYLSHEVIYKEIFGLAGGACDPAGPLKMISLGEYTARRKDSFGAAECEIIYSLAKDYFAHMQKNNLADNNTMSRALLAQKERLPRYALTVLDEVQDMTEVNLTLFKSITFRMFCVGDALQMINASYFSFAFLKRLLYEQDISSVAELVSNYRSTRRIADISENLGKLSATRFGVHSFVLKIKPVDTAAASDAVYVRGSGFLDKLNASPYNHYTVVVSGVREKECLRQRLHRQEILTVSEIKGLERETVVLYNLLSSNANRWRTFERASLNRKTADENSVYRYYFNLLYVGVSRAKLRLYINESEQIDFFKAFFNENFSVLDEAAAVQKLLLHADKTEAEQDEILERVKSFVMLGQYDNARFAARSILNAQERTAELTRIDVNEQCIARGNHREAGIRFLQGALYEDAKRQFVAANDDALVKLTESCMGESSALGLEVLSAFTELSENEDVRKIVARLVAADLAGMRENIAVVGAKLKKISSK